MAQKRKQDCLGTAILEGPPQEDEASSATSTPHPNKRQETLKSKWLASIAPPYAFFHPVIITSAPRFDSSDNMQVASEPPSARAAPTQSQVVQSQPCPIGVRANISSHDRSQFSPIATASQFHGLFAFGHYAANAQMNPMPTAEPSLIYWRPTYWGP